jgi:hypothetical protein
MTFNNLVERAVDTAWRLLAGGNEVTNPVQVLAYDSCAYRPQNTTTELFMTPSKRAGSHRNRFSLDQGILACAA